MHQESYSEKVWKLIAPQVLESPHTEMYLVAKLVSETTELLACGNIRDNILDESGDVWWYTRNLYTLNGWTPPVPGIEYACTKEECLNQMLCLGGQLLGEICKRDFHKKKIYSHTLCDTLDQFYKYFYHFLIMNDLTLEQVESTNLVKLNKRHGSQYKPEFYTSNSSERN